MFKNCSEYIKKDPNAFALGLKCWHLLIFPGSCPPSIFSASELNFRVRNGNGWTLTAINTNLLAPDVRLELTTTRLTAAGSTTELIRHLCVPFGTIY